jgi:hypothetical protein
MDKAFWKIGILFGSLFVLAFWVNVFQQLFQYHRSFPAFLFHSNALANLALAGLFFLSAYKTKLAWIQPALIMLYVPAPILPPSGDPNGHFYSVSFFVIGVIMLLRLGFFIRRRLLKGILCGGYLIAVEFVAILRDQQALPYAMVTLVFLMIYLTVLYLMFQERLAVYLKEPKPQLSLKAKELSGTESLYIMNITMGKTSKDIAYDYEVSESTVRNTLARAYKKLGVDDKTELAALAERFDLVD